MSEYTRIVTTETDTAAEIVSARVNGKSYRFDYEGLKNRPAWLKKTAGEVMLEEEEISFADPAQEETVDS